MGAIPTFPTFQELEERRKEFLGAAKVSKEAEKAYNETFDALFLRVGCGDSTGDLVTDWAISKGKEAYHTLLSNINIVNDYLKGKDGQLVGIFSEHFQNSRALWREGHICRLGEPRISAYIYTRGVFSLRIPAKTASVVYHECASLPVNSEYAKLVDEISGFDGGINLEELVQSRLRREDFGIIGSGNNNCYELYVGDKQVVRYADEFLWNWRASQHREMPLTITKLLNQ